ncbi:hypothetical protein [Curtobacterium flaccumfaciens]|uniref:hypothetical protein n=1 Tax=Curtobacterium flaccumfaciens TaxID=2035 RepID=UPI001BE0AD64|nr:hypothetical protein [Curtobacterium flaccumfaciens]MBT1584128.1 hypothetical protein [Curtobacterium flaccumfaciens pv. flaccumfaciens]MCX2797198.1 hypothetical protein [Curtobacterium flaccumfaciens pv. flaccumfaciens]
MSKLTGDDMDPSLVSLGVAAKVVDPAAAEGAKVAGNLFGRLLGPLADEMGASLAEKYRISNVQRVARRAARKVALDVEGAVPARVAAAVFDAAQWAEEEFVTEYLSGVLASARTSMGQDDRAVAWTALVSRMPTSAIKLHYALYFAFHKLVGGSEVDSMNDLTDRNFYVGTQAVTEFLNDNPEGTLGQDALNLLDVEGLIGPVAWGPADYLERVLRRRTFPDPGIVVRATPRGMSLMLQAFGHSPGEPESIVHSDLSFSVGELADTGAAPLVATWVDDLPPRSEGLTVI